MTHGRSCLLKLALTGVPVASMADIPADVRAAIGYTEPEPPYIPPEGVPPVPEGWEWALDRGGISLERVADGETLRTRLSAFDAWLTLDEEHDFGDGAPSHIYHLRGNSPTGMLPEVAVPGHEFEHFTWIGQRWGSRALILASPGKQRHSLSNAILTRAEPIRNTVYRHTGWRRINGAWRYLHGKGAVGDATIPVRLEPAFWRFGLPTEPSRLLAAEGMDHLFGAFLRVAPLRITLPLLAAMFLAPLMEWQDAPFAFLLTGDTGLGKSSLTALVLSGYGDFPDEKTLPLGWASTANYLANSLFAFKDAPIAIDDVGSAGTASERETQGKFERLLRAQGNRQDRGRMTSDGSTRPLRPPRGLLLISAQQVPTDEALLARAYQVEFRPGDVDLSSPRGSGKPLDLAQAPGGLLAMRHAIAGYAQWLTPPDEAAAELRGRISTVMRLARTQAALGAAGHARLPETLALLLLGVRFALDFARSLDVLSPEKVEHEWQSAAALLVTESAGQKATLVDRQPARRFLVQLQALLVSRRVCLLPQNKTLPPDHKPPPTFMGWFNEKRVYLLPGQLGDVFRAGRENNESLGTEDSVMRELRDAGVLKVAKDGRLKGTAMGGGVVRRCYILSRGRLAKYLGIDFDLSAGDTLAGAEAPAAASQGGLKW